VVNESSWTSWINTRRNSQPVNHRSVFHRVGVARNERESQHPCHWKIVELAHFEGRPRMDRPNEFAPVRLPQLGGGRIQLATCMGKWRPTILGGAKGEVSGWVVPSTTNRWYVPTSTATVGTTISKSSKVHDILSIDRLIIHLTSIGSGDGLGYN
jgi:hypothetical protein